MDNKVMEGSSFLSEFIEIKSEVLDIPDIKVEEEELDMNLKTEESDIEKNDVFLLIAKNEENCDMHSSSLTNQASMDNLEGSSQTKIEDEYVRACHKIRKRPLSFDEDLALILCPDFENSDIEEGFGDSDDDEPDKIIAAKKTLDENARRCCAENVDTSEVTNIDLPNNIEVHRHSDADGLDEDNLPLSALVGRPTQDVQNDFPKWRKISFAPPADLQWKDILVVDQNWDGQSPLFFFNKIFDNCLVRHICEQTNIYAMQSQGKEINVRDNEMKTFFGILMLAGIMKAPSIRSYWQASTRFSPIADSMSRDRFLTIKRYLHFNDNTNQKPVGDPQFDKLFKIRPLLEKVKRNCNAIPQEEHQAIGEQIIPSKARSALKQFNPNKPYKWGFKMISRAGASGLIYDFELYTGKGASNTNVDNIGIFGNIVIRVSGGVPENKNYKIFYNNWFSSLNLAKYLKNKGIHSLCTVRPNRLKGCRLIGEKELEKKGQGAVDHRVDVNSNCIAIKWYNNKPVHLLSDYAGIEPLDTCQSYDNSAKIHIDVSRPFAVKEYDKFIGGVDLCDMLLELYRINFKSLKYYMRIFYYLLDLSVVNGWLLYRRVCVRNPQIKIMTLKDFKADIGHTLVSFRSTPKRGKPSNQNGQRRKQLLRVGGADRFDGLNHWPEWIQNRYICRVCKNKTFVHCSKCFVTLCFLKERNCFRDYHTK